LQPRKVFLSYRREDSAAAAGRLSDRLVAELGDGNVFMGVDGIALGADFVKRLIEEVACCDTLLAVIGPRWLDVIDEAGDRRLDDPNDFVRVEIAAALQRDIPVIPILLDGTKIPRVDRLPPDLKHLSRRNGLDVRQASFHSDVGRLIRELKATAPATTNPSVSKIETDRTDPNMVSSDAVARSEPPATAASHSDRLASELEATDTCTVTSPFQTAPDPSTGDQSPKPTLANPVKRCIYGTLLGSPVGIFIYFVIVTSTVSVHSTLEDWIIVFGLLIVGSIELITIGRRLINMGILKASIICACFATVLSAGISLGISRAAGVQHSMAPVFLWPFVLLAIQGLFLAVRLRLGAAMNQPSRTS
jgi:TIR domain